MNGNKNHCRFEQCGVKTYLMDLFINLTIYVNLGFKIILKDKMNAAFTSC